MNSLVSGATVCFERLRRTSTAIGSLFALLLVCLGALLERKTEPTLAADRALQGVIFGLAIPILAYVAVGRVTRGQTFKLALAPLAAYGANRKLAALGTTLSVGALVSLLSLLLAVAGVFCAHGVGSSRLLADVMASAWIGALAGAVYTAWFSLGANFGKNGQGRTWALVLDFFLGGGASLLALPWPRGHLRNLLGGEPVLGFSQPSAVLFVTFLTVAYMSLAVSRLPR